MPTLKDIATGSAVRAGIRSFAQFVVSLVITELLALPVISQLGLEDLLLNVLSEGQIELAISAALFGAWVSVINRLEARWPAIGYLNIIPGSARYDATA